VTNDERHEDQLIEEALAGLERDPTAPGGPRAEVPRGAEAETLVRLYGEVLGLVAYDAPPLAPAPELREKVLALVRGDETMEVEPEEAKPAEPPAPPVQFPAGATLFGQPLDRPAPRPARRWPLALAASVALACLGLSGWLWLGIERQRAEIQSLRAERDRLQQQVAALEREGGGDAELAALRQRLGLVTSPAVEVMPLRPVEGETAAAPGSRGVLYVAADHQHWFLSVDGLPPAGPERDYQLWFIAGGKPVPAGTFDLEPGAPANLSAPTMPAGTELAAITVEPAGGAPQPTGPMVLKSAEPLKIL
jgi:Anti-sigma-K factor rskA